MIFILIYFGLIGTLLLVSHRDRVWVLYKYLVSKRMSEAHPDFYNWEEGDTIYYMESFENDSGGTLLAMCENHILVKPDYGNEPVKLYPYQIKMNKTHDNREASTDYAEFHADVLPVVTEKENTFPHLEHKVKRLAGKID